MAEPGQSLFQRSGGGTSTTSRPTPSGPQSLFQKSGGGPTKKKKDDDGLLGSVLGALSRLPGDVARDLYTAAVSTPAGLMEVHRALAAADPSNLSHLGHSDTTKLKALAAAEKDQLISMAKDPLKHPGLTALTVLPVGSAGVRTGAALGVLGRAAMIEKAGAAASVKAGARALAHPNYGQRSLTQGGLTVHPETSRSALGAVTQKAVDKAIQSPASGRVGAALTQRKIGKTITSQARVAENVARTKPAALIAIGRRLTDSQQKALQLVAEQAPLMGRIQAAARRVETTSGRAQKRHQAELDLLEAAAEHLEPGEPLPTLAGGQQGLQRIYNAMERVAGDRETLLQGLSLLSEESIRSRQTAAGRISLGAHYEEPTPGKLGISPDLEAAQTRVGRLQGLFDRSTVRRDKAAALLIERLNTPAVRREAALPTERPRTPEEAAARLALLEKRHDKQLNELRLALFGKAETARVNERTQNNLRAQRQEAGKTKSGRTSGASTWKSKKKPTIVDEHKQAAEVWMDEQTAKLPADHPVRVAWEKRSAELAELRRTLSPDPEELFGGATKPRDYGKQPLTEEEMAAARAAQAGKQKPAAPKMEAVQIGGKVLAGPSLLTPPHGARTERLGAALSVAKDDLERIQKRVEGKMQPTGILGQEQFEAGPGAIRIPDVATRKGARALARQGKVGVSGTIGHLKPPGSVTHSYTGVLREHGLRREDTTQLVGESALEAAKYAGLRHIHELVRLAASPTPSSPSDIAVRLDNLAAGEKMPLEVRKFLDSPDEFFAHAKPREAAQKFEQVRQRLFIDTKRLDPEALAEFTRLAEEGKIGWVPRRILGDFAKPSAPLSSVAGKTVGSVDAINNASRFAILYLKPAYAIPNILGNAALNVLQQGFASIPNLRVAARMNAKLGNELTAYIDTLMEEGFAQSISAHGQGPMAKVVDKAAQYWSKGVDRPFRRSSFLYEAKRAGYHTPEQMRDLITNPGKYEDLAQITVKANREIIDYSNLTPVEREIIRRVIFFYPWVKGSTVYAGRLLREHPVKAAALGGLAQYGKEQTEAQLGGLPPYLQGVFPSGNRLVNPNAAAILQTPAEIGAALGGLASGDTSGARRATSFLTPALSLILAEATRKQWNDVPYPKGTNALEVAKDSLIGGLPQVRLVENALRGYRGQGKEDLYPPSVESALAQFFIGGIYPRKYNRERLRQLQAQTGITPPSTSPASTGSGGKSLFQRTQP